MAKMLLCVEQNLGVGERLLHGLDGTPSDDDASSLAVCIQGIPQHTLATTTAAGVGMEDTQGTLHIVVESSATGPSQRADLATTG